MAFDPQGSLNLSQHIRTNVNNVFASSIPGNENDFIGATPLSGIGFCVDVVLESWTESFVVVIPRNDPASGDGQFGWIPHHHDPRHYHLFFLSRLDFVAGAYFFPPVRNLSLTYVTAQSLGPFPCVGHTPWRPISFGVFNTTLLQGQIVLLPTRAPVFTSFLSSLLPCGPPRGPSGSALGMASRISFRHFSLHLGPYQTTALQEIPIDDANCAPLQLDSWAQPNLGSQLTCMVGLSFLLRVILGRDSKRSLSLSLLSIFSIHQFFPFSHIYNRLVVG